MPKEKKSNLEKHIVVCPHCGKQALDHMADCPHCGKELGNNVYRALDAALKKKIKIALWIVLGAAALALVLYMFLR